MIPRTSFKFWIPAFAGMTGFLCLLPCPLKADGLSTSFADVQLVDIPVGIPYNLAKQLSKPLDLKNLGDEPVNVQIDVIKPEPGALKTGAEAIPDPKWVVIQPNHLELAGRQRASTDVTITVPRDPAYRGKQYQVMIWSKSRPANPAAGMRVNAALLSRLRFTTAP